MKVTHTNVAYVSGKHVRVTLVGHLVGSLVVTCHATLVVTLHPPPCVHASLSQLFGSRPHFLLGVSGISIAFQACGIRMCSMSASSLHFMLGVSGMSCNLSGLAPCTTMCACFVVPNVGSRPHVFPGVSGITIAFHAVLIRMDSKSASSLHFILGVSGMSMNPSGHGPTTTMCALTTIIALHA